MVSRVSECLSCYLEPLLHNLLITKPFYLFIYFVIQVYRSFIRWAYKLLFYLKTFLPRDAL